MSLAMHGLNRSAPTAGQVLGFSTGTRTNDMFKQQTNDPTSFPGSLFSGSIVVEKTTMEAEKRDPGNEVDK